MSLLLGQAVADSKRDIDPKDADAIGIGVATVITLQVSTICRLVWIHRPNNERLGWIVFVLPGFLPAGFHRRRLIPSAVAWLRHRCCRRDHGVGFSFHFMRAPTVNRFFSVNS